LLQALAQAQASLRLFSNKIKITEIGFVLNRKKKTVKIVFLFVF
jgi:hypothetical protein